MVSGRRIPTNWAEARALEIRRASAGACSSNCAVSIFLVMRCSLTCRLRQAEQADTVVLVGYVGHRMSATQATTSTASIPGAAASVPSWEGPAENREATRLSSALPEAARTATSKRPR